MFDNLFDPDLGDKIVGWVCLFVAGFLIGLYF